jgi:hypothetical protein
MLILRMILHQTHFKCRTVFKLLVSSFFILNQQHESYPLSLVITDCLSFKSRYRFRLRQTDIIHSTCRKRSDGVVLVERPAFVFDHGARPAIAKLKGASNSPNGTTPSGPSFIASTGENVTTTRDNVRIFILIYCSTCYVRTNESVGNLVTADRDMSVCVYARQSNLTIPPDAIRMPFVLTRLSPFCYFVCPK